MTQYLLLGTKATNHSIRKFHFVICLQLIVTLITRIRFTTAWKPADNQHKIVVQCNTNEKI